MRGVLWAFFAWAQSIRLRSPTLLTRYVVYTVPADPVHGRVQTCVDPSPRLLSHKLMMAMDNRLLVKTEIPQHSNNGRHVFPQRVQQASLIMDHPLKLKINCPPGSNPNTSKLFSPFKWTYPPPPCTTLSLRTYLLTTLLDATSWSLMTPQVLWIVKWLHKRLRYVHVILTWSSTPTRHALTFECASFAFQLHRINTTSSLWS